MFSKFSREWFAAAGLRALRTLAQTALGMFTIGMALEDIKWVYVLSVSVVAAIYSFLTSVATHLPEVGSDGTLTIDKSDPEKDNWFLSMDTDLDTASSKKKIIFNVDRQDDSQK